MAFSKSKLVMLNIILIVNIIEKYIKIWQKSENIIEITRIKIENFKNSAICTHLKIQMISNQIKNEI